MNGSAQASEDGADRLSIWNAGIGFRLADPGARGFGGIYCTAVYTRRAGMRSRGDWERALLAEERNRQLFTMRRQTNTAQSIATSFVGVECVRILLATYLKRVTSIGLLIFIDDPRFEV